MAARKIRRELDQEWRKRIQGGVLIKRLCDNAQGKLKDGAGNPTEMSPSQVRSAEILLKKVLPDLSAVDWKGTVDGTVNFNTFYQEKPKEQKG